MGKNGRVTDTLRTVHLTRTEQGRYTLTNERGLTLEFGHGDDLFTPVELLLAAIGGCSAIDVDYVTSRRSEPRSFDIEVSGDKRSDPGKGSHMDNLHVNFSISFPDTDEGREAAAMVGRTVAQSRDRLCTVSRTVSLGSTVTYAIDGEHLA